MVKGSRAARIYAVADLHGRPERLEIIGRTIERFNPDLLVVAGDIATLTNPQPVVGRLAELSVPVLAVRGNTDLPKVDLLLDHYPTTRSLHLKSELVCGVRFVGISGTIPVPFRSRLCVREAAVLAKLESIVDERSVLVAHPPPWGTLDQIFGGFHSGSWTIRELVSRRQPRLLICGHIHECAGTEQIGNTVVVNCSMNRRRAGAIIDLEGQIKPKVEMLF